jgi:hypothetical protein
MVNGRRARVMACRLLAFSIWSAPFLKIQAIPASCPAFTPDTNISKISPADRVFRFDGGFVAVVHEVRVDTDGSPVAYNPKNTGTTDLCNGLDPVIHGQRIVDKSTASACFAAVATAIAAGWKRTASPTFCVYGFFVPATRNPSLRGCNLWGRSAGKAEIPLQTENDPAPGFFVSVTSSNSPGKTKEDQQARYLDADRIPYAVVPGALVAGHALEKGGIAWVWKPQTGLTAAGVVGDTQTRFGEISVALAQKLETGAITPITLKALLGSGPIPWPYRRTPSGKVRVKNSPGGPVVLVYFSTPPDPPLPNFEVSTINATAEVLLARFGGAEVLKHCLGRLLP